MLTAIPTTIMRGGTSKGLYLDAEDLPADEAQRDRVLLALMGSPDARQIDGLGGAHPLTSKVAVLSKSKRDDADIDYLFLQVSVEEARISDAQNCGNLLAGVGPWAIERGWVKPMEGVTAVRIHMVNTGGLAVVHVPTRGGGVTYEGEARIDGVPGTAAPISMEFLDIAGASCGALLPTGHRCDEVDGVEVTCIDNGMPVVLLRATDLGVSGHEAPAELEANTKLKERIENIRLEIGPRMGLGDVAQKTVPKTTLLAAPTEGGAISTRSFIPHRAHDAIGVLAAVSVATACAIDGTVAADLARIDKTGGTRIDVEHPAGFFSVDVDLTEAKEEITVQRAALLRTARLLMRGDAFIPSSVWAGR